MTAADLLRSQDRAEQLCKDKARMRTDERSLDETEEWRVGQMEEAVCFVQLSTAFW